MGIFSNFIIEDNAPASTDFLHLDLTKKKIKGEFGAIKFIDKDTKQSVIYIPSVQLSGYGSSFNEADEMLKFSLNQFFDYILRLPHSKTLDELKNLGWQRGIFNKRFSNSQNDAIEALNSLNADQNTIERVRLKAA